MLGTFPGPHGKKILSNELSDLPAMKVIDITNYLLLQTPDYTASRPEADCSLEAYDCFKWQSDKQSAGTADPGDASNAVNKVI